MIPHQIFYKEWQIKLYYGLQFELSTTIRIGDTKYYV